MSLYEELALDRERARHARLKAEQTRMEPLSLAPISRRFGWSLKDFVNQTLRENREKVDAVATGQRNEPPLRSGLGM
jgi:hypothetical protein